MIYPEKVQQKHKEIVKKLMLCGFTSSIAIQKQMKLTSGTEFDLKYIVKLKRKVMKDRKRRIKNLMTPEGQAKYMKQLHEQAAAAQKILAKLKK